MSAKINPLCRLLLDIGHMQGRTDDEIVGRALLSALRTRDKRKAADEPCGNITDDQVYLHVLEMFGRECPHPPHRRKEHNTEAVSAWWRNGCQGPQPQTFHECEICGTAIVRTPRTS